MKNRRKIINATDPLPHVLKTFTMNIQALMGHRSAIDDHISQQAILNLCISQL